MTTTALARGRAGPAIAVAALGCFALLVRTVSMRALVPIVLLGLAGAVFPLPSAGRARAGAWRWSAIALTGVAAFALVRFTSDALPNRLTLVAIAGTTVAATAEEAFFRRFLYGVLEPRGAAIAVVVTAALFALVHLPTYGSGAMPIDFTAGLLFGWQRWASGGWSAPAATHVFANLLQMG